MLVWFSSDVLLEESEPSWGQGDGRNRGGMSDPQPCPAALRGLLIEIEETLKVSPNKLMSSRKGQEGQE